MKTLEDYNNDYAKLQSKFNKAVKNKDQAAIKRLLTKMNEIDRKTKHITLAQAALCRDTLTL